MTAPSVTVLIDTYNYARFLPRAIDSVLDQRNPPRDLEILVIDDGSTDGTEEVAARYGGRICYLCKPNGGQASALNLGFREARGDIICLLDADDYFYPNKIELVIAAFSADPAVGLVHNEFDILDASGRRLPKTHPEPTWSGRSLQLQDIPAQLQELILLGHPWTTTTSAMSICSSLVRDLRIPEDIFPHSPDLFLGLVLPFMAGVAVIASPQTGYVFHGENVGLFRSSAENRALYRRQMSYTRTYIEGHFDRRFITYMGNGLYESPPLSGGLPARWNAFTEEWTTIRGLNVDSRIKSFSEAKLTASFLLPGRVYDAVRDLRAGMIRWRRQRRQKLPATISPPEFPNDHNQAAAPGDARRAYDTIASYYDHEVEGDFWMRAILWQHYDRVFRSGQTVLDAGCGTGLDAAHLASRGLAVVAIDVSPAMIAQTEQRAAAHPDGARIQARVLDIRDLAELVPAQFDGIISSFAALSTLSDLDGFADDAAHLLRPGGRLIIHLLNRFSLWEWLGLLIHGEWSKARNLGRQRGRIFTIGGVPVDHVMRSRNEAFAAFAGRFQFVDAYGLGIFRPPHNLQRVPAPIVDVLAALDRMLGGYRPFINWGRFIVLDMVRTELG